MLHMYFIDEPRTKSGRGKLQPPETSGKHTIFAAVVTFCFLFPDEPKGSERTKADTREIVARKNHR